MIDIAEPTAVNEGIELIDQNAVQRSLCRFAHGRLPCGSKPPRWCFIPPTAPAAASRVHQGADFWYAGKIFAALDKEQHVWAGKVPPTVDEALDCVFAQTGTVLPLEERK